MKLAQAIADEVRKRTRPICVVCDGFTDADRELIDAALITRTPSMPALCEAIRKSGGPSVTRHQLERHKGEHITNAKASAIKPTR